MNQVQKQIAYKGFDANFSCRGFQYEVDRKYVHSGSIELCKSGFHSCLNPWDVLRYYPLVGSRFGCVNPSGIIRGPEENDSKVASSEIFVEQEIQISDFINTAVNWTVANAATTGDWANAATTGNQANAATTGFQANAATTGNQANAATTGDWANAATTGDYANAATTGNQANAATTGFQANAATTGIDSISAALGQNSTARAGNGGWIVLAARKVTGEIITVRAAKVGGPEGIKSDVDYQLNDKGVFEEVAA